MDTIKSEETVEKEYVRKMDKTPNRSLERDRKSSRWKQLKVKESGWLSQANT